MCATTFYCHVKLRQRGEHSPRERKEERKKCSIIPWISLSKLQLQRVVDLIMSVSISDVQNVFTCQQGEEMSQSTRKAELSSSDANPSELTDILRWQ